MSPLNQGAGIIAENSPSPGTATPTLLHPFVFAIGLLFAELGLATLAHVLELDRAVWLVFHLGIVLAATALVLRTRGAEADRSPHALAILTVLIGGPVGALFGCGCVVMLARERAAPQLLKAWYERISLAGDVDAVTRLYDNVAMGRALQTSAVPPQEFEQVMLSGSLEDRQAALGLIARRFEPSYAPALRLALVSPEPIIRVQAAAVAVKVRAEVKSRLAADIEQSADTAIKPQAALALVQELRDLAGSGLVEDDDHDRGIAAARALLASVAEVLTTGSCDHPLLDPAAQTLIETEFLRRGQFAAFRTLRAASAAARRGGSDA